jgi:hypothetical protein
MAITKTMNVSTAEAKNRLPELIRIVANGEQVVSLRPKPSSPSSPKIPTPSSQPCTRNSANSVPK